MARSNAEQPGGTNLERQPRKNGTWVRVLTWSALVLSFLAIAIFFLYPTWGNEDDAAAIALGGPGNALVLLVFLELSALILDLVVIALTMTVTKRGDRRRYVILSLIAFLVVAGPIAASIVYSAAVTNG